MPDQVGDLVKSITDDLKVVVRGEVELAKREVAASAKRAGVGIGMFGGAGVLTLAALPLLLFAGSGGLALLYQRYLGFSYLSAGCLGLLTTAVILLILAGILVLLGKAQVSKVRGPQRAIAQASATVGAASQAIAMGTAHVEAEVARRKAVDAN